MPGIHRAQRFMHLAGLLPRSEAGYSRALPLRWEPSFTEKAVPAEGFPARKEWEVALKAIGWLRRRLDAAGRHLQRVLVVADGAYCVKDLFRELPGGVSLMARCAKNRALYEPPPGDSGGAKARRGGAGRASTERGRRGPSSGFRRAAAAGRRVGERPA
jgi:hypothetical protein